jgi:hypothetical protein
VEFDGCGVKNCKIDEYLCRLATVCRLLYPRICKLRRMHIQARNHDLVFQAACAIFTKYMIHPFFKQGKRFVEKTSKNFLLFVIAGFDRRILLAAFPAIMQDQKCKTHACVFHRNPQPQRKSEQLAEETPVTAKKWISSPVTFAAKSECFANEREESRFFQTKMQEAAVSLVTLLHFCKAGTCGSRRKAGIYKNR